MAEKKQQSCQADIIHPYTRGTTTRQEYPSIIFPHHGVQHLAIHASTSFNLFILRKKVQSAWQRKILNGKLTKGFEYPYNPQFAGLMGSFSSDLYQIILSICTKSKNSELSTPTNHFGSCLYWYSTHSEYQRVAQRKFHIQNVRTRRSWVKREQNCPCFPIHLWKINDKIN